MAHEPSRQIKLLVTDRQLRPVGHPISRWARVDAIRRRNEPGTGTALIPRHEVTAAQLAPGNRVVMIRHGKVFLAGPIERPGPERWSVDGEDTGPGMVEITWTDDLAWVMGRRTYPTPSAAATAQTESHWAATGLAEDIIRSLVNLNAGPGALPARQVAGLTLGTYGGLGSTVKISTRFEPLGDVLRLVAAAGGGLSFFTTQVGKTIVFNVSAPRDVTRRIRFSRPLGNLRSYSYEPSGPAATTAIVGGQNEGVDRVIVERTNVQAEADWGRFETFVDRRQSNDTAGDTTELDQAGDEVLARSAPSARLSAVCIDVPTQRYGTHYDINDLVTVELMSGARVVDLVRGVHVTATPQDGETVTALVGSEDATADPMWVAYLRDVVRRMDNLEVR